MMIVSTIFCTLYGCLTLIGLRYRTVHHKRQQQLFKDKNTIQLADLSVIIPFRNEENRIEPLLRSFVNSSVLPKNIIFVDDHSDDATVERIQSVLNGLNFQILRSDANGKKLALHTGIEAVNTKYILTLDADIEFQPNYFEGISLLPEMEMHILPVKMDSKGIFQLLEMDSYLVNSLNDIAAGISHPIVASGANLLFDRNAYLKYQSLLDHQQIASGDDQFLLHDFNKNKVNIGISTYRNITISTPAPKSISEFIQQRLRWISKSPKVKDSLATRFGLLQVGSTLLLGVILCYELIIGNYALALALLFLKSSLDGVLAYDYLKKIGKTNCLLFLPIYEVLLPIYTIFLAFLLPFYRPKWKGRKI